MKHWVIQLVDGKTVELSAEDVAYDHGGNILFYNLPKMIEVSGQDKLITVRCFMASQVVSYYPKPDLETAH